jgi:hypothetical protein
MTAQNNVHHANASGGRAKQIVVTLYNIMLYLLYLLQYVAIMSMSCKRLLQHANNKLGIGLHSSVRYALKHIWVCIK